MSKITGEISYNLPAGTVKPEWAEQAWYVTLQYKGRTMGTPFYGGGRASEPTVDEVVESLTSDSAGVDNAQDYYDWCDEYGTAPSRESQATYDACLAQRDAFREFTGDDYDAIVTAPA